MSDERTDNGHWPKGVSGNPGGYSTEKRKAAARVAELARAHTEDAIKTLAAIMLDGKATRVSRIAAANALLDRGYGKPPQCVGLALGDDDDVGLLRSSPFGETYEVARTIAFILAKGVHEQERQQLERARASEAEIIGATHGND